MKKGIQYSHYCGTELMELISSINLCMELVETDKEESVKWGKYAIKMTENLRNKIAELDKINGMIY
jgi:hypothetical protein